MNNLNEPRNIIGMAEILADEDEDINIDEIEQSITNCISFTKKEDSIDLSEEYDKELEQLSRQFKIGEYSAKETTPRENSETDLSWSPKNTGLNTGLTNNINVIENDSDVDADNESDSEKNSHKWNKSKPDDIQLYNMTNEERKQSHINKVLNGIENVDSDNKFIQEEEEEDEMARLMEQSDLLRTNLEAEGVNLDRIPDIKTNSSYKEARSILKILQIKNDRLRYCDMFEEGILAAAYGLESVFDGKKEWFGTKIDLVGWPETVKVKLRRMRYDTSTFVSDVMKGYSIGSGWRIIMELLPSLFLYSRDRRLRTNDNLISDNSYRNAIRDLHDG